MQHQHERAEDVPPHHSAPQTNYCAVTPRGKGNTNQVEPEHTRRLPASSSLQHVRDDACHGA